MAVEIDWVDKAIGWGAAIVAALFTWASGDFLRIEITYSV